MKINKTVVTALSAAALSMTMLTGFGLGDLAGKAKNAVSGSDCGKNTSKSDCRAKKAVTGAAIGLAVEVIREMVIDYKTTQTASEQQVVKSYKKKNKSLPDKTLVAFYHAKAAPGKVVKAGNKVAIDTEFEVIPGKKDGKKVLIEENITIYDNEDHKKTLKSLTKAVNDPGRKAGSFKDEFKFKMPVGLPQGVYPVKTKLLVNKKEMDKSKNDIQLVLNVLDDHSIVVATAH